jgi:hypothetical protein
MEEVKKAGVECNALKMWTFKWTDEVMTRRNIRGSVPGFWGRC